MLAEEASRLDEVRSALAEVGSRVDVTAGRLLELTATLGSISREHIAAIDRSGQAVLAAFERAVVGGGASLDSAAGTLAAAARDLQAGAATLAPRMGNLASELGALGREVALLLAARGPDGDIGAVVLGELDRLGAGMERLTELIRLAEPAARVPAEIEEEREGDTDAAVEPARSRGLVSSAPGDGEERTEGSDGMLAAEIAGLSAGERPAPAAPDDETSS
jgi:hypothetical protein